MAAYRRSPTTTGKGVAALTVIVLYFIFTYFRGPIRLPLPDYIKKSPAPPRGAPIQFEGWKAGGGEADVEKAERVKAAMKFTFDNYRERAWGADDIKPVTGGNATSRNGWGAFIVDTSTTLALMGLWEELGHSIDHIVNTIDFGKAEGLVDPFETTIRYLGGLVSLTDLIDAKVVPSEVAPKETRDCILSQATFLANKLAPSFDTPTGMVWTRVNFSSNVGQGDPPAVYIEDPTKQKFKHPAIGLARAGSNILENRVLSRLTGDVTYFQNATRAWAPLVWNKWVEEWPGILNAPIDIITGQPVGRQRHWDAGHDSYYEYLIKVAILSRNDKYTAVYEHRWEQAAQSLREHLITSSSPARRHFKKHYYMGKYDKGWYINEMSHLAHFAPGNLLLGGRYLNQPTFITLGKAILEACRHTYNSTPTGIGPEKFSWIPSPGYPNATFVPKSDRQRAELDRTGYFVSDARYKLRPEYVESLFYGWRITGEQRYRDWAWEAFLAIERHCKAAYGYAALADVTAKPRNVVQIDESESFWGAETLKYLYLTFADAQLGSLDRWVYSTEGHPFRMIR